MDLKVPSPEAVQSVLRQLENFSEEDLGRALVEPELETGLNHWELWLLLCLHRHLDLQKWASQIIAATRKAYNIGRYAGAKMNQVGIVPDHPGWSYYFHGRGCRLRNLQNAMVIDFDYSDNGQCDKIDSYFYIKYLDSLKEPSFPQSMLIKKPWNCYWFADFASLHKKGLFVDRSLTDSGLKMTQSLNDILKQCESLQRGDKLNEMKLAFLALHLGDTVFTSELTRSSHISDTLIREIQNRAYLAKSARAKELSNALDNAEMPGHLLESLAELGPEYAKLVLLKSLFGTRVIGASRILIHWNESDLESIFEKVVKQRCTELAQTKSSTARIDEFVRVAKWLVLRQRDKMSSRMKELLLSYLICVFECSDKSQSGLLIYILNHPTGLKYLAQDLSNITTPNAHQAAAACAFIGTPETKQILIDVLNHRIIEKRQAAACALRYFPGNRALLRWEIWRKSDLWQKRWVESTIEGLSDFKQLL
jgi:hypothetical protein